MNVSAYSFASGAVHGVCGLKLVVVKNTMSPATAGNAVTFSSSPDPSTFNRIGLNVTVPVAPLSRTPTSLYACDTPTDDSRSLPVPKKMYWCTPPTLTVAIDEKIG